MKMRGLVAAATALVLAGGGLLIATPAMAGQNNYPPVEDCTPSAAVPEWVEVVVDEEAYDETVVVTPAVAEVSHTDYWYMPVHGEVGRWSHSDKGAFDTYDWTLYYKTGTTQKHVDVEAVPEVTQVVHHEAVTHEVVHPEIPAVVCEPPSGHTWVHPPKPVWVDECGLANGHWTFVNGEGYKFKTWTVGAYTWITVVPDFKHGYIVPLSELWVLKAKDSGVLCPTEPTAVPAVYDVNPTAPTCEYAGSFNTSIFPIDRPGYTLTVNRPFDGPGFYTITATAKPGFVIQGSVSKVVSVLGAIGYQNDDPEAVCYSGPNATEVVPATPVWSNPCGPDNGKFTTSDQEGIVWTEVRDGAGGVTVTATAAEGFVIAEDAQTVWTQTDTDVTDCPVTPPNNPPSNEPGGLAETGGTGVPWAPIGWGTALLLSGLSALFFRRYRLSLQR